MTLALDTNTELAAANLELEIARFTRKRFAALSRCDHITAAKWQRLIRRDRLKLANLNHPQLFPKTADE